MELGFVETLRRRWETLGIKNNTTIDIEVDDQNNDAARQKVLDGEIVKEVLRDALKGNPLLHLSGLVSDLCMPLPQLFLQSMLSKGFYICSNTIQQSYHGISYPIFTISSNRFCRPILRPQCSSLAGT
jgi:hypothetical protein